MNSHKAATPPDELKTALQVAYTCNAQGELVHLSKGYRAMAQAYGGPRFMERWGRGAHLLEAVDPILRPFYYTLHTRALAGEVLEHEYQCPTPRRDRRFRLRLLPLVRGQLVAYEHALIVDRKLDGALTLSEEEIRQTYTDGSGFIWQCYHCRKVMRQADRTCWDWVPVLLASHLHPVSHTLCLPCFTYYYPEGRYKQEVTHKT